MTTPRLTAAELYRRGLWADRDNSDMWLADTVLFQLASPARAAARAATREGRDWPDWVEMVFGYECDRRDRRATRRELREMVR